MKMIYQDIDTGELYIINGISISHHGNFIAENKWSQTNNRYSFLGFQYVEKCLYFIGEL